MADFSIGWPLDTDFASLFEGVLRLIMWAFVQMENGNGLLLQPKGKCVLSCGP